MSWFSPLSSCNNLPSPWAHISIPSLSLSPEGAFLDVFELMTSLPALPGCLTACWRWPTVVCPGWPVCYISHPTVPPPKVKQRGKGNWWHSELHCTALLYTTLHCCTLQCTIVLCFALQSCAVHLVRSRLHTVSSAGHRNTGTNIRPVPAWPERRVPTGWLGGNFWGFIESEEKTKLLFYLSFCEQKLITWLL